METVSSRRSSSWRCIMLSRLPLAYMIAFVFCNGSGRNEPTWTGRKSFAAAIRFWASTVIHSTCRCHSGGTAVCGGGGGARMALVRLEYVTRREWRIDDSAGRRSSDMMMRARGMWCWLPTRLCSDLLDTTGARPNQPMREWSP